MFSSKAIELSNPCVMCSKEYSVHTTQDQYDDWRRGVAIQMAIPNMHLSDREFLISRICPTCQEEIS